MPRSTDRHKTGDIGGSSEVQGKQGDNLHADYIEYTQVAEQDASHVRISLGDWPAKISPDVHTSFGDMSNCRSPNSHVCRFPAAMAQDHCL